MYIYNRCNAPKTRSAAILALSIMSLVLRLIIFTEIYCELFSVTYMREYICLPAHSAPNLMIKLEGSQDRWGHDIHTICGF